VGRSHSSAGTGTGGFDRFCIHLAQVSAMRLFALASVLALLLDESAPTHTGVSKLDTAVVAPWCNENTPPDATYPKALQGETSTIKTGSIEGPQPLSWAATKPAIQHDPADMLFPGNFEEMPRRNPEVNPSALAASLGFKGRSTRQTLETGCDNAIDFHFIDARTAAFALDNYVYKIWKI
jgi:hypothetical protein